MAYLIEIARTSSFIALIHLGQHFSQLASETTATGTAAELATVATSATWRMAGIVASPVPVE
jgi:hypothetical protein